MGEFGQNFLPFGPRISQLPLSQTLADADWNTSRPETSRDYSPNTRRSQSRRPTGSAVMIEPENVRVECPLGRHEMKYPASGTIVPITRATGPKKRRCLSNGIAATVWLRVKGIGTGVQFSTMKCV